MTRERVAVPTEQDAPPERPSPARSLPPPDQAREWLSTMTLIRRFEERAGEMYARAKVGGFLHLSIGEEATIVGSARAMRAHDYLVSTYRSHGHALVRGTDPGRVMAELFGRVDGCSKGRGGSMHMFDAQRRFMGGYGIVGGNLPIAAGIALACDYTNSHDVVLCTLGDGAVNQGTFGETMNLAALWRLPVVFLVTNNQFGMGTSLERHSAVTELAKRGEGFGVPGVRCDGMDVLDTHAAVCEAIRAARERRQPMLVEAITYRFRGHSMADPEEYRTREQVAQWRLRDPIASFGARLREAGVLDEADLEEIDRHALAAVDAAVAFAEASPFPEPDSLYDDVYVLSRQIHGTYALHTAPPQAPLQDRDAPRPDEEIPMQLTRALSVIHEGHGREGEQPLTAPDRPSAGGPPGGHQGGDRNDSAPEAPR
ncbi:MAG: pyruvate dehydrogenase (acetyl-transferring) E1 component subunit alpha [Solirubrobacterales bacterium]|nr:pyruvate dehydrogenase (acetyl-transferring) E1 component subunit alpha [Solirubrobacterales bacterium]